MVELLNEDLCDLLDEIFRVDVLITRHTIIYILALGYLLVLCTQIARSLVMNPNSTVWMTDSSKFKQK